MHEFRKAVADDAEAIANLYRELVPAAPINVLPERIAEISSDENTYLLVGESNNKVVATALVSLCKDVMFTRQPFAIIENVIVSQQHQHKGIGKALMKHVEAFCLAADCSKIMLLSGSDKRDAHNFYIAMGYDPDAKAGFIKKRRDFNT